MINSEVNLYDFIKKFDIEYEYIEFLGFLDMTTIKNRRKLNISITLFNM